MKGLPIRPFAAVRRRSEQLVAGIPLDLIGVVGYAVAATVLLAVVDVSSTLARAAVGFPLLFFAPGYVTVSTLFPRASSDEGAATDDRSLIRQSRSITDIERAALSFGLSFAILPLLALAIALTSWGYTGPVVVSTVACFTLVGAGLAAGRRLFVPASERYRIMFGRRLEAALPAVFDVESPLHLAVNVALVLSMVLALTTVGYALVSPQDGEQYTSLQLLTENESGDRVASGYPEEIEPDEPISFVVAIDNQEERAMDYTFVVQEQRLEDGEVVERTELQRIDGQVSEGATGYAEQTVTPTTDEGPVRISVLLYTDGAPETPTHENAYRHAYFWTTVTEPASTTSGDGDDGDGADETDDDLFGILDFDEGETGESDDGDDETDAPDDGTDDGDEPLETDDETTDGGSVGNETAG